MSLLDEVHVSVDIEACGEVLVSLGACEFNPRTGEAGREFYGVPSIKDQMGAGLKMDAGAFLWWLKQDAATLEAVWAQQDAHEVLFRFSEWLHPDAWVWAYPTSFDLPVIERVYRTYDLRCPWTWTKTMDGRTLWRLACDINPELEKVERNANPAAHNALADAKEQAGWFARYLNPLWMRP